MSYWLTQYYEIRVARAERLVDGRKRLTRFVSWKQTGETVPELQYAYGDLDPFANKPTGWDALRLSKVEADSSPANNGAGNDPVIVLTYEGTGTVKQVDETKNNGALLLRTITSFYDVPATPSGYTLVTVSDDNVSGFPYKVYAFAKGTGEVSRTTSRTQNGTTEDGTIGVTRLDIDYLTVPGAAEPTWSDVAGYVKISVTNREADGHEVWNAVFAKGDGIVSQTDETRNNGALLLRTIVELGATPATPASYIVVSATSRQEAGHVVYTSQFAQGSGEISRTIDYSQSDDQGTTGITKTVIRHLVAPSASVQPTSLSGSVEIGRDMQELDGHRIWITTWAKGTGLVLDESTISASAALVVYHRIQIGAAPTTPTQTIGGTVTLFDSSVRKAEGFDVYDYRWSEGSGQASITTDAEPDGALVYTVVDFGPSAATPSYPGGGTAYLVRLTQKPENGYFTNTAVYKKPPASQTRRQTIQWQKPGLASFTSNQLTLSPPTTRTLLASVAVTYSTTQDTTTPWEMEAYASLVETWTPTDTGIAQSRQRGLGGYIAGSSSIIGTASNYNGVLCDTWSAVLVSSIPSSRPTGATVLRVDNDPYITATDGTTVVYRITKTSYTF